MMAISASPLPIAAIYPSLRHFGGRCIRRLGLAGAIAEAIYQEERAACLR